MPKQEVIDEARRLLAFLVEQKHLTGPDVIHDRWVTTLRYASREVGIELELDWRERDAFTLIVRPSGGGRPKGYYMDDGGKCRVHLENVIRRKGWQTTVPLKTRVTPPSDERMIIEMTREAQLLAETFDRIESDVPSLFDG